MGVKRCEGCGDLIYIKKDNDGVYRPYESWLEGAVEEGEWELHHCHEYEKPVKIMDQLNIGTPSIYMAGVSA
jgi:hypothetical protein